MARYPAATRFAYGSDVHRNAIAAEHKGRWFSKSWFGRFEVEAASGGWPGLDLGQLSLALHGSAESASR